jgi:phosphoribosylformimino-5-aminoimidazole carboxamide ribonucleotide (ProFAR) isomerase
MDLESEHRPVDARDVERLHRAKTGALLGACVDGGAVVGAASPEDRARIARYGRAIGLAFQVVDDVLDATEGAAQLGKTAGKDRAAEKATYVRVHGLEGARRIASELLDEALSAFTSRILVGVDVRGGQVSVAGWTRETQVRSEDAIRRMQQQGATRFVYTNVDRDGMLEGPDLEEVRRVSRAVRGRFLYSGGIGSLADLEALRGLRLLNLAGVIAGKALYEGRFGVPEGQAALD